VNVAPTSRWVYAYVAATIIGWLTFLSVAGAYCPMISPASGLRALIAPAAMCQIKVIVIFWMFLCVMSLAGGLLIKRLHWRGRAFYVIAVLTPILLFALGQLLGEAL